MQKGVKMQSTAVRKVLEQYPREEFITLPGLLPARVVRGMESGHYFTAFEVLNTKEIGRARNVPIAKRPYRSQIESIRDYRNRVSCLEGR